ncbi:MAG: hypothetical protein A2028_01115 [Candidatus Aminicenantes bacterium RBG_19FT_COMBO_59_29]|nr:MAG: hypothetical protein A2028_01115 [Candidatus Aminicenantes bacterium RBG_19FT_COMBO_59_29]
MKNPIRPQWPVLFVALAVLLSAQEDFLKIEASIDPRKLSRGEEGAVLLKLSLQENISVSPQPDFIIEFKPCAEIIFPKNFYAATDLEIETAVREGEESLELGKAIRIPFTVSPEAKKGSHILEGRVKYFARSQKEGWCVRNTAKFFVPFSTRSFSVRKSP